MVQLRTCSECQKGNHTKCERGRSVGVNVFGGWHCICPCRGRSDEEIERDWREGVEEILRSAE